MPPTVLDSQVSELIRDLNASLERIFRNRLDSTVAPRVYYEVNAALIARTDEFAAINGVGPGIPPRPRLVASLAGYQLERQADA